MPDEAQPEDARGNVVPVMKPVSGSDYSFAVGATAARNSVEIAENAVRLYATQAMKIRIGNNAVDAASGTYDMFLPQGIPVDIDMEGRGYISAIRIDTDGTLYINGWK